MHGGLIEGVLGTAATTLMPPTQCVVVARATWLVKVAGGKQWPRISSGHQGRWGKHIGVAITGYEFLLVNCDKH